MDPSTTMPDVLTLADPEAVAEAAAEIFVATAAAAVEARGRFVVALAGGSTPEVLYRRLAGPDYAQRVPWRHTWIVFGDERCVPEDHDDSNYRMARETLLDHVPIPRHQVLRMEGEHPQASRGAFFYEERLRRLYPDADFPRLDLCLLGMGDDGHTASLFPGTDALEERERWVSANYLAYRHTWRITLTLPVLTHAAQILFLVTGSAKAERVAEVFGGAPHEDTHPAELVIPEDGSREVLLDRAAAALLEPYAEV